MVLQLPRPSISPGYSDKLKVVRGQQIDEVVAELRHAKFVRQDFPRGIGLELAQDLLYSALSRPGPGEALQTRFHSRHTARYDFIDFLLGHAKHAESRHVQFLPVIGREASWWWGRGMILSDKRGPAPVNYGGDQVEKIDKWMMLAIGLVGGWVISTAPGWMHASSYEDWWDIATAFGTVGAAAAAVGIASRSEWRAERERIRRGMSLKWFLAHGLGNITSGAEICRRNLDSFSGYPPNSYVEDGEMYELRYGVKAIDPSGLLVHIDSIHTLGDDAHRFSEVLALAKARHEEISGIAMHALYIPVDGHYLNDLAARMDNLRDRTEQAIALLNKPV